VKRASYEAPYRYKYSPQPLSSDTLNIISFLIVKDQVSHPYKTTSKIIVLYILILKFLEGRWEDKRL